MTKEDILKRRAQEISLIPLNIDDLEQIELLVFHLEDEIYAIEISYIEEVCLVKNITEIPFMPNFIKGVINLRGYIYSIVDLANYLQIPKSQNEVNEIFIPKIIILKSENMEFGILTNKLEGITKIKKSEFSEVPLGISNKNRKYIKSIANDNLIILDTEKLLSDENMKVYQEI